MKTKHNHLKNNSSFFKNLGIDMPETLRNPFTTREIRRYMHLGGENYANLKEKVPVLGADGKPIRFRVGGKTLLQVFEPRFKDNYVPTPGTEHIFVKPSFAKSKTRKQRDGKQCGGSVSFAGIGSIGALTWVGLILFLVIQAGNSGAFRGSSR
jgi:hypothetical protein